jgi:regulatory protein
MNRGKPASLGWEELFQYALRILGGRAYSTAEMRIKLQRRAERPDDVDDVLERLKANRYLDDSRFAESFTSARLANERFGRRRVLRDLRQRRVAPKLAEKTVATVYRDVDESALIEEWIRHKYRNRDRETLFQEDKDLASAYRRLCRAGFRSSEVVRVLKKFARNPELLDNLEPPEEGEESA